MSDQRRPTSLDGIKRRAKAIKSEQGIRHQAALELSAKEAGFQSFTHARRLLESNDGAPTPRFAFPERPRDTTRPLPEFWKDCQNAWIQTLDLLNPSRQSRMTWEGSFAIRSVLGPVMEHTRSHAHLPTGGGHDFSEVRVSTEPGCLEFVVSEKSVYIARPKTLILEHVEREPSESFLLLELADLAPSGVYAYDDEEAQDRGRRRRREELVELSQGNYVERSVWDQGHLGYDRDGSEIPLPAEARLIFRWFNGKMLFVTKGSMWNGTPATYDGRHDNMSAEDIRSAIEQALSPV